MIKLERNQIMSKVRRLCRQELYRIARENNRKVTLLRPGRRVIQSPSGYISEIPHGVDLHCGFEPGYGSKADWERLLKKSVFLSGRIRPLSGLGTISGRISARLVVSYV